MSPLERTKDDAAKKWKIKDKKRSADEAATADPYVRKNVFGSQFCLLYLIDFLKQDFLAGIFFMTLILIGRSGPHIDWKLGPIN